MAGAPRTVVVTGASGFVGSALLGRLGQGGERRVRACYRSAPAPAPEADESVVVGEIGAATDWRAALRGVDAIIHTAGHAHKLERSAESEYHRTNVEGTLNLARQAAEAGVRRLVFLSTIKVNGERTAPGRRFRESDPPAPEDAYGRSKWEAERGLAGLARQTGLEIVILRPPLVYGPGARGNLNRLMRLIRSGVPLPLAALRNRRSMIALGNLCSAVEATLDAPAAAGRSYLLAEEEDFSTPDLIRRLAGAMKRRALLFPVPEAVLRLAGAVAGRADEVERLVGSLRVDASLIARELGWRPSAGVRESDLDAMAMTFMSAGMRLG